MFFSVFIPISFCYIAFLLSTTKLMVLLIVLSSILYASMFTLLYQQHTDIFVIPHSNPRVSTALCYRWYTYNNMFLNRPGPQFNIKMTSYQYRKSHCGDRTVLRPSYLHNGISNTDKLTSLYWIRDLFTSQVMDHTLQSYTFSDVMTRHSDFSIQFNKRYGTIEPETM